MRLRGLLFDKDGTLLDFHQTWMPFYRSVVTFAAHGDASLAERLLVSGGYDPATGRIRANTPMAAGTPKEIAASFAEVMKRPANAEIAGEIERLLHDGTFASVLVPDAVDAISRFRRRASYLGIATSDSQAGLQATLLPHGILDQFDFLAAYDSGHGIKPGPGMALAFCAACDFAPDELCVIGDNLHDLDMGRAAGAAMVVGVLTGTSTREDLAGHADKIYPGIAELAADDDFLRMLG